ncbi:hypothetical protein PQD71_gp180 [Kosakonia phage Kc263]|uniref:Uncharacterized protein n=1 Tax=Kosakonia phage Kc263 TaxID=2863194 RepID=A0AAE7WGW4_9CAUD|nr:hypothetical protein PQD71_gp180 [Kosakonia phage Kc263]QYN80146.1 hypothetical protein [Kosakonia phage Kc263]
MNNFAYVNHYETRNAIGVKYIKDRLISVFKGKLCLKADKEDEIGSATMSAIKDIARRAFGCLPLLRTRFSTNSVETFQNWFNDFSESNNLVMTLRVTGVWDEETQAAFDLITKKYESVK